jgi:spectinomycin phosphotransferase
MLSPPDRFDPATLLGLLRDEFGVAETRLEFVPLGEDSWSYRAGDLWVSVRRDLRGHDPRAYAGATALRESGLPFVLAPLAGASGRIVFRLGPRPVVVFPFVERAAPLDPATATAEERARAARLVARVHAVSLDLDLSTESYRLPFEDDLAAVVAIPDAAPVDSGPFGLRLRRLVALHRDRIESLRAEYEELAGLCRATVAPDTITHGEPLPANFLRTPEGLLLADWSTLAWGPPERDWSHVARTLGPEPPVRAHARRLYDLWWILSEITEYAVIFRATHDGGADDVAMWGRLTAFLPEAV